MSRRFFLLSFVPIAVSVSAWVALAGTATTRKAPATAVKPQPAKAPARVAYADIQSMFDKQCAGCHNEQMLKGKLSLHNLDAAMKGGVGGAIIVPGKSAESRLVKYLEGTLKPQMPMNAPPLPSATIAQVKRWIDEGARADAQPPAATAKAPEKPPSNLKRIPVDVSVPVTLGELKAGVDEITFNADILPILQANCLNCHGAENPRSQLRVSAYDTVMAGGKSGVPVKPGDVAQSLLVKRIEGTQGRKMPLNGSLSQPDIDRIKKWIEQGAKRGLPDSNRGPEMLVAVGPLAQVTALTFSPDSADAKRPTWVAIGFYRRVILVELPSGNVAKVLDDHMGAVHDLQFSSDGKQLAAAGGADGVKGEIKVWDTTSWKAIADLKGHTDTVYSVSFSADGKRLVSGSNDKTVRVWDVAEGKALHTLKDPADAVYAVAFSPDGNLVAGGGADKTVKIWKLGAGLERTLTQSTDWVTAVLFSRDGQQVIGSGMDGVVRRWLVANGQNVANMGHGEKVQALALSKDGQLLASAGADKNVKVWSAGNAIVRTLGGHTDWVISVAISPDNKYLASGTADGSVRLYALADGRNLATLLFAPTLAGGANGADPEWLYVTAEGYYNGSPEMLKLAKWRVRGEVKWGEPLAGVLRKPEMVQKALAIQAVEPVKLDLTKPAK